MSELKENQNATPKDAYERAVIGEACLRCGLCRQVCPVKAIVVVKGRFVCGPECLACANCVELCPVGAIELQLVI